MKPCIILSFTLAALPVASWFTIDWTDAGSGAYPGGVVLRDRAGEVLRVSLGEGDVDCRPYYEASADDWIVKALVASEDGSFWTHCGVRPLSALRAAWQNIAGRRRVSGASTITMQTVRLIRPHPKSLWWKWKEAIMALKMERAKSKTWILSQYLNRAPFGSNFIGIEAAAQGWFGKSAKALGLGEAAMLAGMVQAPSRFRPDRGFSAALKRRDYVLSRMRELGIITDEQLEGARSVIPEVNRAPRPFKAPFFCDWYLAKLGRDRAAQRLGGDFTTSLDADVQALCENAVNTAAQAGGHSVAAVVLDVATGETLALACSGDYFDADAGQVNTAAAPRPAGSTLKPLLAALAMDRGLVTPEQRLADVPVAFKGYRPANFDGSYRGLVTLRDSLVLSLNIPFVRLLERMGVPEFAAGLRAFGFAHLPAENVEESLGLGLAIGNAEVTLVELAAAYAALARRGGGVVSEGAAYLVSEMLSGEERAAAALGHVADVAISRFAWKTGTSSAYRDAWTVAWNPEYVVAVWCGHKRGGFGDRSLVGAKAAAPVAWGIARQLYPRANGPWFAASADVVHRRVCSATGLPASPDCPATEMGTALRGRSAALLCPRHRADGALADERLKLKLLKPMDGAEFQMVGSAVNQKVVCQVGEVDATLALWWFLDGAMVGESVGRAPFALEMRPGSHTVTCTTADGISATARFTVTCDL